MAASRALACLVLSLVVTTYAPQALAQEELAAVEVRLSGGEVVGKTAGLGTASVEVEVHNGASRPLEGIRLAAYYNTHDVAPPPGADWRIHEFIFEPALQPGQATTLRFSDDGAAEYVLVQARRIKFAAAVRYARRFAALEQPLVAQGGATYIAVRDLIALVGGGISAAPGKLVLERAGRKAALALDGGTEASVDGRAVALARGLLTINGRAYIALDEAARLLGLTLQSDGALDLHELAD